MARKNARDLRTATQAILEASTALDAHISKAHPMVKLNDQGMRHPPIIGMYTGEAQYRQGSADAYMQPVQFHVVTTSTGDPDAVADVIEDEWTTTALAAQGLDVAPYPRGRAEADEGDDDGRQRVVLSYEAFFTRSTST